MNILIVEDNADLAQTTGWIVESFGHDYRICLCGSEAIANGPAYRPDVVVMDIGLPDINGYELCRRLRAIPEFRRTVFIAQSGRDDADHYEQAKDAGFDHHVVKPATMDQIGALLDVVSVSLCEQ